MHTFAFVDIVGFTAYTASRGDAAGARLASALAARIRSLLPDHRAEEVKSLGDGMLIRASDPDLALGLAVRLAREADTGELPRLRIGVESGPAVRHEGEWYGDTVNRAARLCAAARPGQVLVGAGARAAVNGVPLSFRRRLLPVRDVGRANAWVAREPLTRRRRLELPALLHCGLAACPHNVRGRST